MADRYLVAGGNGVYSSSTNWSATSGGASGASAPVSTDKIFADANSAGTTIALGAAGACLAFDFTGFTGTFNFGAYTLSVAGTTEDCKFATGMTLGAGTISFTGTSGTVSLYFAGVPIPSSTLTITRAGIGGTLVIADTVADGGTNLWFSITGGTLSFNTSVTYRDISQSGASTRALVLGASAVLTGGTSSTITSSLFTDGGGYTLTANVAATVSASYFNVTADCTIPCNLSVQCFLNFDAGDVVTVAGNFSCVGTISKHAEIMHHYIFGSGYSEGTGYADAKPLLVCNGAATVEYATIREVEFSGSATWSSSTCGDAGYVDGFTFLPSTLPELFWVGGTGNLNDSAHWSLTSGGAGGAGIPLAGSVGHFDNAGLSNGDTVTLISTGAWGTQGLGHYFGSLDFSDLTKTITAAISTTYFIVCGSLTLSEGITFSGSSKYVIIMPGSDDVTFTLAGTNLLDRFCTLDLLGNPNAGIQLLDALTGTNKGYVVLDDGEVNASDITISVHTFTGGDLFYRENNDTGDEPYGLSANFTNTVVRVKNSFEPGGTDMLPYSLTVVGSETMSVIFDVNSNYANLAWNGEDPDGTVIGSIEIDCVQNEWPSAFIYICSHHDTTFLSLISGPDFDLDVDAYNSSNVDDMVLNAAQLYIGYADLRVYSDPPALNHYGDIFGGYSAKQYANVKWHALNDPITFVGCGIARFDAANPNEFFVLGSAADFDWGNNFNVTFGEAGPYYPPMMSGMGVV